MQGRTPPELGRPPAAATARPRRRSPTPARARLTHGFRSSFRDWTAECSDAPNEVCELALAHVNNDRTEAAYRRTDLYERRRRRELLARMIEDLDRRGPEHRPLTESDVADGSKELTERQGLELLTPLAACDLFAKTAPTVRRAVADRLVYSPFALNVTGKPVRLIDLRSAVAYWGPPSARRLDEMRTNGNLLRIEVLDYNILHPEPLVTATDPEEEGTRE